MLDVVAYIEIDDIEIPDVVVGLHLRYELEMLGQNVEGGWMRADRQETTD